MNFGFAVISGHLAKSNLFRLAPKADMVQHNPDVCANSGLAGESAVATSSHWRLRTREASALLRRADR
jgi:hypothetical protein